MRSQVMTHVVTDNCNGCRYTDCVMVCPVDCFYDAGNMLVINPEYCIDCSACVAECPVEAIYPEDELPPQFESAIEKNESESMRLADEGAEPITDWGEPLPTAEQRRQEMGF